MIEIDGSTYSGSGTVVRYAMALATVTNRPVHLVNVRAKRPKPGLRPQHLMAAQSCARLSGGSLEGAEVGSREITYRPGPGTAGGEFHFDIGTAGSAIMLAFTLIPPALFAAGPSTFILTGGLFQENAPGFFHLRDVFVPSLAQMGASVRIEMLRPGYVPRGEGKLVVVVEPLKKPLKPFQRLDRGKVKAVRGTALASHLADRRVSKRMADRCRERLRAHRLEPEIEIVEDSTALQKGAALQITAETDTGCAIGAGLAGRPGISAESIAESCAGSLWADLRSTATTDRYLADQLILFGALAEGTTRYLIPYMTEHVQSNLWLVEKMLGVKTQLAGKTLTVEGIGMRRAELTTVS